MTIITGLISNKKYKHCATTNKFNIAAPMDFLYCKSITEITRIILKIICTNIMHFRPTVKRKLVSDDREAKCQ